MIHAEPAGLLLWMFSMAFGAGHELSDPSAEALRHLRLRYLDVKWDFDRPIVADLTGDGITDMAVTGRRGDAFAIGLVIGPIGSLATMQSMVWPRSAETACVYERAPRLTSEPLSLPPDLLGCRQASAVDASCAVLLEQDKWITAVAARGTSGLRVGGEDCDEVHLFWNVKAKSLDSWIARR